MPETGNVRKGFWPNLESVRKSQNQKVSKKNVNWKESKPESVRKSQPGSVRKWQFRIFLTLSGFDV